MKKLITVLLLWTLSCWSEPNPKQDIDLKTFTRGTFVVVGRDINDPECEFFTIQSAINSGATKVRIATETYPESLNIDDQSIELLGGYSTCTQAANSNGFNPNQTAVINAQNGTSNLPGITISGASSRHQVTLRNLRIEQGVGGAGLTRGGGISTIGANLALSLLNVDLFNNEGTLGGGLSVFNGNTDVEAVNLLVRNNRADAGGGVYCFGNQASIVLSDNNGASRSGIRLNQANEGNGGGIYLQSGCQLTTYTGTASNSDGDLRGISFNLALNGNGGGVALDSGSKLFLNGAEECTGSTCIGNNVHPINIRGNGAQSSNSGLGVGAGIFATGSNTVVIAKSLKLDENVSQRSGGGAYIGPNSSLLIDKPSLPCWNSGLCNQISSNIAGTSGGGMLVTASSTTSITHTHFKNNNADNGAALLVGLGLTSTPVEVISSIFSDNGDNGINGNSDNNVIYSASDLNISFSTIADNQVLNQSLFQSAATNANELNIFASIIHDPGVDVYGFTGSGSSFDGSCLLVNEDNSFVGESITVGNPDLLDRVGGDYHVGESSPAIDMCGSEPLNPTLSMRGISIYDMDGDFRGYDDPEVMNIDGPYDAGVDEVLTSDIIFADGFE